MERVGEVTAIKDGLLEVTFCSPEECEKCHGCAGHHKPTVLTVPGSAQVGDAAIVSLPDEKVATASLLVYVLPLIGLMVGLFAGFLLHLSDGGTALLALLGLVLMLSIAWLTEKKRKQNADWQPKVLRIIPKQTK